MHTLLKQPCKCNTVSHFADYLGLKQIVEEEEKVNTAFTFALEHVLNHPVSTSSPFYDDSALAYYLGPKAFVVLNSRPSVVA